MNHAREVFQDAEKYDEVYDCVFVTMAKQNKELLAQPIYNFTENDIWQYLSENGIEVNPLYQQGYTRVGCIGCPMATGKAREKEFKDFPTYRKAYHNAFDKMLKARKAKGKDDVTGKDGYHAWHTAEDVMSWWMEEYKYNIKGQERLDL